MRSLFTTAAAMLVLSIAGCGGGSQQHTASSGPGGSGSRKQTAAHLLKGEHFPGTPGNAAAYGYPASSADNGAIRTLVKNYYAAAATADGASACSMIYPTLEHSVAEDYGHAPAPVAWRGNTCQVVMEKFFKKMPDQPRSALAETTITGVRVYRDSGYALLHSRVMPRGEISVQRAHGAWKVEWLIGKEYPPTKT